MNIKRFLSILLVLAMTVGLVPGAAIADGAETAETKTITQTNTTATMAVSLTVPEKEPVAYIDANGEEQSTENLTDGFYYKVREGMTNWTAGWYVVEQNVTIASRITVTGDVHLILKDGATMTASAGITVTEGNSLTIYGQQSGTGALIANGTNGANGADNFAGPGGAGADGGNAVTGSLVVNGATVTITGGKGGNGGFSSETGGAGGNGSTGIIGSLTVNRGTVFVNGGNGGNSGESFGEQGADGGNGGIGVTGSVSVNGGSAFISGGSGGAASTGVILNGKEGSRGRAIDESGTLTAADGLSVVAGNSSEDTAETPANNIGDKKYVYIEKSEALTDVAYLDAAGEQKTLDAEGAGYTRVKPYLTSWTEGWYVVDRDVTIAERIAASGTVNLILKDNATLTAKMGITTTDATLNIYAQSTDDAMGALIATGAAPGSAGIGGGDQQAGGTVTINGGTVIATGSENGAGIGGGNQGVGTVTINGGTVTATGGGSAAGIGGGNCGSGSVIINDGTVNANGGYSAAGIGGGCYGSGSVIINDGTVNANGGHGAAGIGGGAGIGGNGGNITIKGGVVNANGGEEAAGIGGGGYGNGGTIEITGGDVTAKGGSNGAGVGAGKSSSGGSLTVSGAGKLTAIGSGSANAFKLSAAPTITGMQVKAGADEASAEEVETLTNEDSYKYAEIKVAEPKTAVAYLDWNGTEFEEKTVTDYFVVNANTKFATDKFYVVSEDVEFTTRITPGADNVKLILADGKTMTAKGFANTAGKVLSIYGQSEGTGTLSASGSGSAAIGGSNHEAGGTVNIYGGIVTASGSNSCAGIGGGNEGAGGTVNIYGGTVTATGGKSAAGIGGGYKGAGGTVNVYGGTVTANGGENGAGIGGGSSGNGGTVNIYGGTVTATGQKKAAGIGGGKQGAGGTVNVYAGTVTATGGENGAGIGGGYSGSGGTVTINGGTVTATGGENAAGIGSGRYGESGGTVTINNGLQVKAGAEATETIIENATFTANNATYKWVSIGRFHNHKLTNYALTKTNADNDTITATCTDDLDNCTLEAPDYQAKLVILAPAEGGGAATLTGATDFGVTAADIEYYKGNDKLETAPTEDGFFKAQITVGGENAYVTYGVNEIVKDTTFNASTAHGDFTVPAVATANATVTIAATPDTGYELAGITVTKDDNSTVDAAVDGNNGTFTMPAEKVTVSAEFKLHDYTITKSEMTNGSVTVAETAQMDDTVTVTVNPATGYELDTLKYGNTDITATEGVYSFKMPASDVTISATFKLHDYNITKSEMTNGSVTVAATAKMGDSVEITVAPDAGYELDTLKFNNTEITADGDGKYKFTMPAADTNISASFKKRNVAVSVNVEGTENTTCTAKVLNDDFTTAEQPLTKQVGDTFTLLVGRDDDYDFNITVDAKDVSMTEFTKEEYEAYLEYADKNDITVPASTVLKHVTMPGVVDNSITLTITFAKQRVFTILYKPADSSTSEVWCKFDKTEAGNTKVTDAIRMKSDAVMGDGTAVYSLKVKAGFEPTKVAFASSSDGFGSNTMTNISIIQKAPTEDNDWTNVSGGKAVVIGGSAKTVIAAFISDANAMQIYKDNTLEQAAATEGVDYRLAVVMDGSTATVTAPDTPTKEGYTFKGWRGYKYDVNGMASEQVYTALSSVPVRANTTLSAVWEPVTPNVKLNPNNGDQIISIDATYDTPIIPQAVEKAGFILEGWTVGKNVTESGRFFQKGSIFDLNTGITEDLELNAKWKHVHSYTCVPINYSEFGEALSAYYKYLPYLHIEFCGCADVHIVAHTFNEGGVCTGCGYTKPGATEAKLEVFYWKDGAQSAWMAEEERTVKRNEEVIVDAFWQIGDYQFSKWQYSTDNGQTWADLAADTMVGFIIPCSMQVRALYVNTITEPQLNLSARNYVTQAQGYNWDSVLFQMNYKLPEGYTLVDAGVRMGDNAGISYYEMKERNITMDNEAKAIATGICVVTSILGGGINTYESSATETYYAERENSVLQEMTAATLAEYMLKFKPVNVEKYPPIYWETKVTAKNRTGSVNTLTPLSFIQKNNGNHFIYGMAYLTYKDSTGVQHTIYTDAIPVTRNQPTGTAANTHTLAK